MPRRSGRNWVAAAEPDIVIRRADESKNAYLNRRFTPRDFGSLTIFAGRPYTRPNVVVTTNSTVFTGQASADFH